MPTIAFSLKDLCKLVGRKLSVDDVARFVSYGKGELENYDKALDEISVSFGDTNLPYLWSVEGVARLIRGILGIQKGIPEFKAAKSDCSVIVDKSVKEVRPFIGAFVARGGRIDDYFLKQMIALQEGLCENYGRKRRNVSIGLYNFKRINFPVHYKAVEPTSVKFVPLEFKRAMNLKEIISEHPKGRDYGKILEGFAKWPILIDSRNEVLSFPPIINSAWTGKVEVGDNDLFFEVTGLDEKAVLLAENIFAQALYERGFKIYSVEIRYADRKLITPYDFKEKIKINAQQIEDLIGLKLKENEIKKLLGMMQYNYHNGIVEIPFYRRDIMHCVDVIEDIAIAYGYDKIKDEALGSYTIGKTFKINDFVDKIREIMVGLGCQEIMSPILTNKENLYGKMNVKDFGTIELKEFVSERFSVVRSWILPALMEVLSKNKHADYPQIIFEEGIVTQRRGNNAEDSRMLACAVAYDGVDFTKIKQMLDVLMRLLGKNYTIRECEHGSFIDGRVADILVDASKIGFVGEISPVVLSKWDIDVPVAGFEINLSEVFKLI